MLFRSAELTAELVLRYYENDPWPFLEHFDDKSLWYGPAEGQYIKGREAMLDIPYGATTTYGDIANRIASETGKSSSARAVGGAVGHNPLCIIAPCHRVVGADGSLTGFGGGIDMKVKLLEHEGVDLSRFYRPKRGTAIDPASWSR